MRRTLTVVYGSMLIAWICAIAVVAQERITLGVAESVPALARYQIDRLVLQYDNPDTSADEGVIQIVLGGVERVGAVTCTYDRSTTPTATTLIVGLNKSNLSTAYAGNATTGSLSFRIFHRLVVMNEAPAICGRSLAGSLTGTPQ